MKKNENLHFKSYGSIINQIDRKCKMLHFNHREHTLCRAGCDKCCMNFSVLPIEFHSILSEIRRNPPLKTNTSDEGCLFLVDHQCVIYKNRPSICRSHGLPILNMDSDGENWELSYCELNFTKVDEEYFSLENGFKQDVFNSKLYLLNRKFIADFKETIYAENELIDIRKLTIMLKKTAYTNI